MDDAIMRFGLEPEPSTAPRPASAGGDLAEVLARLDAIEQRLARSEALFLELAVGLQQSLLVLADAVGATRAFQGAELEVLRVMGDNLTTLAKDARGDPDDPFGINHLRDE